MQALDSAKQASPISLLSALTGALWGASLLWFSPGSDVTWLPAVVFGAALQWGLVSVSLQIAAREGRFYSALIGAALIGTFAALVLLPLTHAYTHHRPLGAVTAAVIVAGASFGAALFSARLPVSPQLWAKFGSFLPLGLLLAAGLSASGAGRGWLLLGVALAAGLRALGSSLPEMYPRSLNRVVAGLLLLALGCVSFTGSLAHLASSLL